MIIVDPDAGSITGVSAPMAVGTAVSAGDATRYDQVLGLGQTWQNVTASRAINSTSYTNSTGKPIQIIVVVTNNASSSFGFALSVNGATVSSSYCYNTTSAGNVSTSLTVIVPIGATYTVLAGSVLAANLVTWWELR